MLYDILAGVFWTVTYLLAIVYAIKHKTHAIPIFCICSNFGWETIALIQSLFVWKEFSPAVMVHIAWFTLDSVIVALFLLHESRWYENLSKKIVVISYWAITLLIFALAFKFNGMLLSSFVIDLMMAVAFLFFAHRKEMIFSPLSFAIGVAKFIGDLCAWVCYRFDPVVDIIGIIVLVCNFAYILLLAHRLDLKKIKKRQEDDIMTKTQNKKRKGFTIVELVIVVAVIAILAGVLIPTFGGIIESANRSADIQLVAQINTILVIEEKLGGGVNDAVEIQKVVEANGLKLETKSKNAYLWYDIEENQVVLGGLAKDGIELIYAGGKTVANVTIDANRPVLLGEGGAASNSNKGKFTAATAPENFIDGYLFISTGSKDGLANAIHSLRNPKGASKDKVTTSLIEALHKIDTIRAKDVPGIAGVSSRLHSLMSVSGVMTDYGFSFIGEDTTLAKGAVISAGMSGITEVAMNDLLAKTADADPVYPNIKYISLHSKVLEIEDEAIAAIVNNSHMKVFYNNNEIRAIDELKNDIANLVPIDEFSNLFKTVVVRDNISNEKISEWVELEDTVEISYTGLTYTVKDSETEGSAYAFVGYSMDRDGGFLLELCESASVTKKYTLKPEEQTFVNDGVLTIYRVYKEVAPDFRVTTEYTTGSGCNQKTVTTHYYYDDGAITYKLANDALPEHTKTVTVLSNDAKLDASLLGLDEATLTIPSNVELLLPYKDNKKQSFVISDGTYSPANYESGGVYDKATMTGTTNLTIAGNVTLNVAENAGIYVDAKCYNDATFYQCYITNECGVMVLEEGSEIVSSGNITAYGVIRGKGTITANGGTVTELMTLYDWYGGTNGKAAVEKGVVPFHNWKIESILAEKLTINHPTQYKAQTGVTVDIKFTIYTVSVDGFVLAGPASASPIFVTNEGSKIERSVSKDGDMKLVMAKGSFSDSRKTLSMGVPYVLEVNVDFGTMGLPLSHMDVVVESGASLTVSNNLYKVMPGSSITVDQGAILTMNTTVVAYESFKRVNSDDSNATIPHRQYPENYPAAEIVVNGTLYLNSVENENTAFAGRILTNNKDAKIIVTGDVKDAKFNEGYQGESWVTTQVAGFSGKAVLNGKEQGLVKGTYTTNGTLGKYSWVIPTQPQN